MKNFFIEHWMFLITITVSISSIFISNYLGRKATFEEYKFELKKERYNKFYLPIIKHLYSIDSSHLKFNVVSFGNVAGDTNFLTKHIRDNFEHVSPEVASFYSKFQPLAGRLFLNKEFDLTDEVDVVFKQIIQQVLKEASTLSETLETPNLARELLLSLYE